MAAIDLKNCTIIIRDGYTGPAGSHAVDNAGGYAEDAVTMTVDGFTGAVENGDLFTVVGSEDADGNLIKHRITAHVETTGNTTSITFTPGLGGAVLDDAIILIVPHEIEAVIGEGNLTYSEKRTFKYQLNRGKLDTVKEEDEQPMEVKLDFTWEFLKSNTGEIPTIEEVFKQEGTASEWVSTSEDPCEPYAVDIVITNTPPCEDVEPEEIVLPDFRWEDLSHDAKASTVSVTGKCNRTRAIITRLSIA